MQSLVNAKQGLYHELLLQPLLILNVYSCGGLHVEIDAVTQ